MSASSHETVGANYYGVVILISKPKNPSFPSAAKFTKRLRMAAVESFCPIIIPDEAIFRCFVEQRRELIELLRTRARHLFQKSADIMLSVSAIKINDCSCVSTCISDY